MNGWKYLLSLKHPTVQLKASVDKQAYIQMNVKFPRQNYCKINVDTDTGVQTCLPDLDSYLNHGFKKSSLQTSQKKDGSSQQKTYQKFLVHLYGIDG